MYQPDPENVYMLIPFDTWRGKYTFNIHPFYYFSGDFLLPDEGYLLGSDFMIIYDVTKIDDGTVNGDNDAQIIAINELLKYFAFQERNWYKVTHLLGRVYDSSTGEFDFISSTRRIIIPPPVSLSDCTRKLFGVGTRYMPEWAQYNDDIALCLKAYAAYYGRNPGGGITPPESPIDENGNIREPKDVLGEFKFTSCEEWFDKQFTLAIGDWRSATTSGWRKSRGFPLVDSGIDLYRPCL